MKILVGGSVAIDNVKTPVADETNLLGGSASYASLAAAKLASSVHLLGIIGNDFPQEHLEMLSEQGVDLSGLERSEQASFTWTGEYHENMNERTTHNVAINVLENWQVSVPAELADAPFV
ncbi:PfkB family carbohydrate kinase, partial [Akkermansiaceae bacterium]|nr:PfkB family carbohydrate kinase [Akkermansiaceae bacterium]